MKNILKCVGAAMAVTTAICLCIAWTAAPNYYGQLQSPDSYNNTTLGVTGWPSATTVSNTSIGALSLNLMTTGNNNIAVGYGAGSALTSGSNNIYLGSAGASTDDDVIRIGVPGTQTNTTIAGVVNTSSGFANTGIYSNAFVSVSAWTNTNAFNCIAIFTNGVTNLCLSNSVPFQLFSLATNAGIYSQHLQPNWIFTNKATGCIIVEE